ncbi:membrane protein insertase YidC [Candidatus Neomarinimicrobiota bacterium]
MMNKNTLIAFLLIAVVLILTPYYLNVVSPPPEKEEGETAYQTAQDNNTENTTIDSPAAQPMQTERAPSDYLAQKSIERIVTVYTDLYTIELNSKNGGSIQSFILNNYSMNDSLNVELIDNYNNNNMLIDFVSLDGEFIVLDHPWEFDGNNLALDVATQSKTVKFYTKVNGKSVSKIYTFFPGTYKIELEVDFSSLENDLSQGLYSLSWLGGLPTTEKNIRDDLFYFKGYVYQGGELHEFKANKKNEKSDKFIGNTDWIAARSKYFIAALIPSINSSGAEIGGHYEDDAPRYDLSLKNNVFGSNRYSIYLGPLEYNRIKNLNIDLDQAMSLGWRPIRPISMGVLALLKALHKIIPNYGIILILFSILIKIVVYPLTKKSYLSTQKMQVIQPQLAALKEKHKGDPQKLNKATMALYKESGVNPMGGCLPILIQMPLLFALFIVFRTTIELRGAPFILWIKDLSAPDTLFMIGDFPINILPLLMTVTMVLQQRMTPTAAMGQQKALPYIMNIMFLFIFYRFPSGLNLYYTLFNLLTILQQKFLTPSTPVPVIAAKKSPKK